MSNSSFKALNEKLRVCIHVDVLHVSANGCTAEIMSMMHRIIHDVTPLKVSAHWMNIYRADVNFASPKVYFVRSRTLLLNTLLLCHSFAVAGFGCVDSTVLLCALLASVGKLGVVSLSMFTSGRQAYSP